MKISPWAKLNRITSYNVCYTKLLRNVENAAKEVPGVKDVSVNFATEKLKVSYQPEEFKIEDLTAAIKKAGYEGYPEKSYNFV